MRTMNNGLLLWEEQFPPCPNILAGIEATPSALKHLWLIRAPSDFEIFLSSSKKAAMVVAGCCFPEKYSYQRYVLQLKYSVWDRYIFSSIKLKICQSISSWFTYLLLFPDWNCFRTALKTCVHYYLVQSTSIKLNFSKTCAWD